ncbi:unnamed protein product [Callosobruchus maculatus]|uniref:DUF7802 domain-containing protein n=1 Tax=Callosobruchus maculatus TaxID=64391 RepID=A0A653C3D2_CALMS|nr:unnamed protein product [Callosobruchus maculatus]
MTNKPYESLLVPGTALSEFTFDGFWDWFVKTSHINEHWKYQPSYVLSQFSYLLGGLITFIHDPVFIYNSSIAVAKMRLPKWSEPFAVGLLVVLIDIPYDIVGVNFLHWTWHDTDPNIYDRHYWVPWNSYYFHSTFAASFTFWFHFPREVLCESDGKWIADKRIGRELLCSIITAFLGPIGGILLFIPLYHPLHDLYNIHSEVTYFILFAIFLLIIWSGDRRARSNHGSSSANHKVNWTTWLIVLHLVYHYATCLFTASFLVPENEVSTGLKEPIGPCNEYVPVQTAIGMTLKKRKYLCPTDYDEGYFDWHCLPKGQPPKNGSVWYTACGTPLENRVELISVITIICIVASVVFYNLHFASYGDIIFVKTNNGGKKITKNKRKIY